MNIRSEWDYYSERARRWARENWPGNVAMWLGYFILIYVSIGLNIVFWLMFIGVNPTLVISVLSAPLWIIAILCARKLTYWLMKR